MPDVQTTYRENMPAHQERMNELEYQIESGLTKWQVAILVLVNGGWKKTDFDRLDSFPPPPGQGKGGPKIDALALPSIQHLMHLMSEWERLSAAR